MSRLGRNLATRLRTRPSNVCIICGLNSGEHAVQCILSTGERGLLAGVSVTLTSRTDTTIFVTVACSAGCSMRCCAAAWRLAW